MEQRFELSGHDHINQDYRHQEGQQQRAEAGGHFLSLAAKQDAVSGRRFIC